MGGLINWENTCSELQNDGTIHVYDIVSGMLISVLGDKSIVECREEELVEVVREDGTTLIVSKNIALSDKILGLRTVPYSKLIADVICSLVAGGMSLKKICERANMPSYAVLSRWRRQYPEFDEMVIRAHEDQADYLGDRALEVTEKAYNDKTDVDELASVKLFSETLFKKAKVHRPQRYGDSIKVSGDSQNPLQIIIETGIRRKADLGYIKDETAAIRDAIEIKKEGKS